jgi:hypothetical protein
VKNGKHFNISLVTAAKIPLAASVVIVQMAL